MHHLGLLNVLFRVRKWPIYKIHLYLSFLLFIFSAEFMFKKDLIERQEGLIDKYLWVS